MHQVLALILIPGNIWIWAALANRRQIKNIDIYLYVCSLLNVQSTVDITPMVDTRLSILIETLKFLWNYFTAKVPCLRKYTGTLQYRRAYRCQSTRSRLRSLNENKGAKLIYPKRSQSTKRVHRASEISVIEDEYINLKSSMKKRPQTLRSMSTKSNNINFNDTVSIKSYHV